MKHFRDRNFLDKRYLSARRFRHWAALFLLTDTAFLFAAWILRPEAFVRMALFLLLFTALALAAGIFAELRRQRREEAALRRFLETPEERTRAEFLAHVPESAAARELCEQLLSLQERVGEANAGLAEYRDYIEAWVHEVKTPLTLFTMVLDNHKDEMPPGVHARLQYAQHRLNENAERILYYARLHTDHPDMRFSRFRLDECAREALEESGRRFLELDSRGKWNGDPAVLSRLRRAYLQAEGDLEDGVTGEGDIQAGNVEIVTHDGVDAWAERLKETDELIKKWKK